MAAISPREASSERRHRIKFNHSIEINVGGKIGSEDFRVFQRNGPKGVNPATFQSDGNVTVLVTPEILEPIRCEIGITNRVLDVLMPQVVLNRASVVAAEPWVQKTPQQTTSKTLGKSNVWYLSIGGTENSCYTTE